MGAQAILAPPLLKTLHLRPLHTHSTMPTGTVKKWLDEKGFGFISPDDGGEDAFCHRSCLGGGADSLSEGDSVTYEVEYDDRKGKYKCSWCEVSGGGGGGGGGKGKGKGKRYDP